ncbi:MAG: recombinase family protein [Cyanothece sp. SIO1E1]|nr:recombinase family protein [Cyanothece sp. SIO1E1]
MVTAHSLWITGPTRSGKTTRLVNQFSIWAEMRLPQNATAALLVFAANGDTRIELANQIAAATQGQYPINSTTPLGFIQDEITLFWPLLVQHLNLKVQFPLRLRPENEQELATRLWRVELDQGRLQMDGVTEYYVVRRTLDLMQLAAFGGVPTEEISILLAQGLVQPDSTPGLWDCMGELLLKWRSWCLTHGLLTYGIMSELYWRHLFPHPTYQEHLISRYQGVLADDVDEYPAIAHYWFNFFLEQGIPSAFTYNPEGGIRLGLGADPQYLEGLAAQCELEALTPMPESSLGDTWGPVILNFFDDPTQPLALPPTIQVLQTVSRAQLLRQTAEAIAEAIHSGQANPQDMVVIAPGLDAIARYTLVEILTSRHISVEFLNDQRSLVNSPMIRALLTLLTLVYPGLGRLVDRDAVAEMLVVLSRVPTASTEPAHPAWAKIDPVRAGLIADHCFEPHLVEPRLLPVTAFPRWDRLGYSATSAYEEILQWVQTQQLQQQQRLIPNPVTFLDRAIQQFFWRGGHLPYDQLTHLRELMETAQHYWEIDTRLRQFDHTTPHAPANTVGQFIQLLRSGTITADPYPAQSMGTAKPAVTLSTIFQYCASRRAHRWHFWLDASSARWLTGSEPLFGAPLFWQTWSGSLWTAADALSAKEARLRRVLGDLLGRVGERLYLCHSELATNGQEQMGPLFPLVSMATVTDRELIS